MDTETMAIKHCEVCGTKFAVFSDGYIGPAGTIPLEKLDAGGATLDDVTFTPICGHIKAKYGIRES